MNSTKIGIALNQKRKVLNHLCAGIGSKRHLFGWFKSKDAEVRFQIGTRSLIGQWIISEKARRSIGWNIYKKWIAMGSRKIWKKRISWMGRWNDNATTISIHLFNAFCCYYFFSHNVSNNLSLKFPDLCSYLWNPYWQLTLENSSCNFSEISVFRVMS